MKRSLFAAAAMAVVLFAANVPAAEPATLKMVKPDWHYRWHEGRWWYWIPENSNWVVWSGSRWVPQGQLSSRPQTYTVSETTNVANGKVEAADAAEPAISGESCPTTYSGYSGSYSGGSGNGYAGYGWSWGPGTAFRNGPGARF